MGRVLGEIRGAVIGDGPGEGAARGVFLGKECRSSIPRQLLCPAPRIFAALLPSTLPMTKILGSPILYSVCQAENWFPLPKKRLIF